MKIVEYKLNLINGVSRDPEWVIKGKYFYDQDAKTFIGFVLDEADRDYYIPDSVVTLDRDQLVQRCLNIHSRHPYTQTVGDDSMNIVELAEKDIPAMVDSILNFINNL